MFRKLAIILLLAGSAFGQATVTGTISDANHNLYANGTASAASVVATGKASTTTGPVPTNSNGTFSIVLPINVSYIFTVCAMPVQIGPLANPTPKQVCFSGPPILISGSTDISSQMNPSAPLLGPGGGTGGGGGGTVTNVSAGSLSPLFTTTVANPTTTPAISFSISNVSPGSIFGNFGVSSGPPSFTNFNVTGVKCYFFTGTSNGCDIPIGTFPGAGWTYVDPTLTAGSSARLNLLAAPVTNGFQVPMASGAAPTIEGGLAYDSAGDHLVNSDGVSTHIIIHKDDVSVAPTANGLLAQTLNSGSPPTLFTWLLTGSAGDITITNPDAQTGPPTVSSATTGVVAGTYNCSTITVNALGKLTSADNGICNSGNTQSTNLVNGNAPSANGPNSIIDSGVGLASGVETFFGATSGNITLTPSATASTLTLAGTNTPTLVLPTGSTASVSAGTGATTGIYFASNSLNYGFGGTNVFTAGVNNVQCNGTCNWSALSFGQGQTFQSGVDVTTPGSTNGPAVFRSANIISGATTASATGSATFQSGDNAATGGAVQTVGNAIFTAGGFTGASGAATAWVPGYTIMGQKYWKDTTATPGTLACYTTPGTNGQLPKVGTCTVTTNIPFIGIISSVVGQSVFVVKSGHVGNAVSATSQTDTAGFFVCTDGSNAGDVVVQSGPCAGNPVGKIDQTGAGGTSHNVDVLNVDASSAGGGGVSSVTGVSPIHSTGGSTPAISIQNATPANITSSIGTDTALPTAAGSFTSGNIVTGDSNGGIHDSGTPVSALTPLYSVPFTGVSSSTSATTNLTLTGTGCTSNVCTMTTTGADGTYRFTFENILTTAGIGCTGGTIQAQITYTSADSGIALSNSTVAVHTIGSMSAITLSMTPGTTTTGANTDWVGLPIEFRAKASTPIKIQLQQVAAETGCSTLPIMAFRPALYGPLGY